MTDTRYDEGDVVATPDGRGVVAAVLTDDLEFPHADDAVDVSATTDRPAHVVGLETVGSAVYRASDLRLTSFEDDSPTTIDGEAETDIVDEDVNGWDGLPEGWDRESVLEYWSSIGGSWETCLADMTDEFEDERAREHCSAMKDEVLCTERWRNQF
ncbi:hypothetical protein [Natrialbaceae archaeon AArc-T1-2]|uniref:hypothetical protein n=1 Tax=Natrialbaceae archaeon AArc-T1-2 TaxID=3053904 RepID=UPI00255AFDF1|nr:hypothetical protein [Natrialbaceae archaeon AArc-T1-2]WIV66666.1 hypothetical protein QQ977_13345 [Natrialbaceae archaeon AArc-T1-2]